VAETGAGEPRPVVMMLNKDDTFVANARRQLSERFEFLRAASEEDVLSSPKLPDVLVIDEEFAPSGSNVVERLESSANQSDLPVILIAGNAEPKDRAEALNWGAADLIAKPIVWEEFAASLSAAVRFKARLHDLRKKSGRDPLTGLPDRRAFDQRIVEEVARSKRNGSALSLLLVDVDRMGIVNAKLGRPSGDRLLEVLGESLRRALRLSDTLFRVGGDEFAAILPDTAIGTAIIVAERLLELVRAVRSDSSGSFHVSLEPAGDRPETSASIGVAEMPVGRTEDEFLLRATSALERAQGSGGNRVWRADDPRRRAINPSALSQGLTERERLVLTLIAQRRTELDIARRMGISSGTVRSHKARIRRKLQVPPNIRLSDFAQEHLSPGNE
jgi:diguanylate cyclase (GGDEF)-like protein